MVSPDGGRGRVMDVWVAEVAPDGSLKMTPQMVCACKTGLHGLHAVACSRCQARQRTTRGPTPRKGWEP